MEDLEKLEYRSAPRLRLLDVQPFATATRGLERENIRPKSIAREMFEASALLRLRQEYDLERAEGLLLAHLTASTSPRQTVPMGEDGHAARDGAVPPRHAARGGLEPARGVERMRDRGYAPAGAGERSCGRRAGGAPDVTRDTKAFTAADPHPRLRLPSRVVDSGSDEAALRYDRRARRCRRPAVDAGPPARGAGGAPGRARRAAPRPRARNLRHTHLEPTDDGTTWRVQQMLVDTEA